VAAAHDAHAAAARRAQVLAQAARLERLLERDHAHRRRARRAAGLRPVARQERTG